ncbi:MAG: phosphopantetheine-binding protein [Elusimicrobiota bacterium]|nr:phosphopantetheine-binding protein [Elusimicrobiota bacterium]
MMQQTSVEDIKKVLSQNLDLQGIDLSSVEANAPLFESLGLDSLDAIELVIILRKNYDIVIENMETGKEVFSSLESLRRYVSENRKK